MADERIHWVVGVDLLPDCKGAMGFLAWLQQRGALDAGQARGLCIIEESSYFTVGGQSRAKLREGVLEAAQAFAEASPGAEALGEVETKFAGSIAGALGDFAADHDAALVLGRQARRGEGNLVRLGRTARRALRSLPVPTVIVPPDLEPGDMGKGPVVVAVDVGDDSLGAVRFGTRLAEDIGSTVRLAHVLPAVSDVGLEYLSSSHATQLREEHARLARAAFDRFVGEKSLSELPRSVVPGPIIESLIEIGKAESACVIVCGSRRLHAVARIFSASVGTELAASATIPVAIVPPGYGS